MKAVLRAITAALAAGLACSAPAAATAGAKTREQLAAQLDDYLNQPKFAAAAWGVKVVSLASGQTLYENHANRLLSPASNTKLYTGALGLMSFGGDHRIATPIFSTSQPDGAGVLQGDLIVSGRGDWSRNERRWGTNWGDLFAPFADVIVSNGVRQITGAVIGDATYFRGKPTGSSWTIEDLSEGETGQISPLTLNDGVMQISVAPGALGEACLVQPLQPGAGLIFSNQTTTGSRAASPRVEAFRPFDGRVVFILGSLPTGGAAQTLDVAVPDPAGWFAAGLKMALGRRGISVAGEARGVAWPERPGWEAGTLVKLGEVLSPPLREMVRDFMKPSQNLEAETLLADVGEMARRSHSPAWLATSEEAGLTALQEWLTAARLPTAEVHFDEGSGLSRNNLTTANATVALLQFMARNGDFLESLPIGGVDGTLRHRFQNDTATRNVRAKTGTLRWANALSGYITSAAGERLAFSIMLNRFEPSTGHSGREEIDALVLMLANYNGKKP